MSEFWVLEIERSAQFDGWLRQGELGVVEVKPGGGPIGAVWLRLFSVDDPGYGFVAADIPELSLRVVPSWQGKGVGRTLLTEMAWRGAESDVTRISLSVEQANRAHRLYADEEFTTAESGPDSDTMIKIASGR